MTDLRADTEVRFLKGIGPQRAEALAEVGIRRVSDLLLRLPFRYEDRSGEQQATALEDGKEGAVEVVIESIQVRPTRRPRLKIVELRGRDASGPVRATWFNQLHLPRLLFPGRRVLLYGTVRRAGPFAAPEFRSPRYELVTGSGAEAEAPDPAPEAAAPGPPTAHAGRVVPVYERLGPLSPRQFRTILHRALQSEEAAGPGLLPESLVRRLGLPDRLAALRAVHFPPPEVPLDELSRRRSAGHRRLIYEEFFLFALGLLLRRRQDRVGRSGAHTFTVDDRLRDRVRAMLPFRLTGSQGEALRTIAEEFRSEFTMRRLLQGDVGSGKTIVAVIAGMMVMHHGAQVALMAPTEVLAEQHYGTIQRLLAPQRIRVVLLTAGLGAAERRAALWSAETGRAQFVVGTHALIQEGAKFHDLGLAIIDEQHRFGVAQRRALVERGGGADLLVMTATPIPRTLTLALHGDLDLSELRELPPGRQPVRTLIHSERDFPEVAELIRREVRRGRQAFLVGPSIEEAEGFPGPGVEARHRELSEGVFRDLRVGLVHGRLPSRERERVMADFVAGNLDVLVATTVIEVGVDVPNATVMVVEHAERFGLAQLHQLRGRVGRGEDPATAILVTGSQPGDTARQRLAILEKTTDGFRIAEEDLRIRGPGDFRGARQWGLPAFRVADLVEDAEILRDARREARDFLASPEADSLEGRRILEQVHERWGERFGLTEGG